MAWSKSHRRPSWLLDRTGDRTVGSEDDYGQMRLNAKQFLHQGDAIQPFHLEIHNGQAKNLALGKGKGPARLPPPEWCDILLLPNELS